MAGVAATTSKVSAFRWGPWLAVGVAVGVAVAVGGHHLFWRHHLKRFSEVRPGAMYRVAQPTEFGLSTLVSRYRVKTVVSLQLVDYRLHRGWWPGEEHQGRLESEYVAALGARHLQWPMGDETYWPWVTPHQYESFFRLMDDPGQQPVVFHCMGGRHRTGTVAALYRLEYDGWTADAALAEMYAFEFGAPIVWQEHNLRTYRRRPRPDADTERALAEAWRQVDPAAPRAYEPLVHWLRGQRGRDAIETELNRQLAAAAPFALELAARLLDAPDDPLAPAAARTAARWLTDAATPLDRLPTAAAVVADFGSLDEQRQLLELLALGRQTPQATPRYEALVVGITNRYTPNRLAYLAPLLDDRRPRVGAGLARYRYCDTAFVRIASITDDVVLGALAPETFFDRGIELVREWLAAHPDQWTLSPLRPAPDAQLVQSPLRYVGEDGESIPR